MGKALDIAGREFGRWKVLRRAETKKHSNRMWACLCACGNEREVIGSDLVQGKSNSCGCASAERISKVNRTHGMSNHRLYDTWRGMIARCYNKDHRSFENYGGRGISVCEDWRNAPDCFIKWALLKGHRKGMQLDRIDNDKGYYPENCRIVDVSTNLNNKRPCRDGTSRFAGVSKLKSIKATFWRGVVYDKGKARWIKYFQTEIEAAIERDNELIKNYPHKKRDQMVNAHFG